MNWTRHHRQCSLSIFKNSYVGYQDVLLGHTQVWKGYWKNILFYNPTLRERNSNIRRFILHQDFSMWKQRRRGNLCWIKSCLGKEHVAMITIWGCQFFNCLCFSVKINRVACKHQANNGVSGLEVLWVCGLCWIFYSCKHGETRKLQPFVLFHTGSCLWK